LASTRSPLTGQAKVKYMVACCWRVLTSSGRTVSSEMGGCMAMPLMVSEVARRELLVEEEEDAPGSGAGLCIESGVGCKGRR
jgi:hypothetical protein